MADKKAKIPSLVEQFEDKFPRVAPPPFLGQTIDRCISTTLHYIFRFDDTARVNPKTTATVTTKPSSQQISTS